MLEWIGWVGGIAFGVSAVPQAIKSIKDGNSSGISWGLIILWTIGEWASLIYALPMHKMPLMFNYIGNIIFVGIITYYKLRPRKV